MSEKRLGDGEPSPPPLMSVREFRAKWSKENIWQPAEENMADRMERFAEAYLNYRSGAAQEVSPVGSVQKITGPERPRCPVCGAETMCLSCKAGVEEFSPPSPRYWCCSADFGQHEKTCKNYVAGDTRELKAAAAKLVDACRHTDDIWEYVAEVERLLGEPTK